MSRTPRGRGSPRHTRRDMSHGPSQRQLRVGEALRHALAEVLSRNEIRDPDLDGVSVTITQIKPSPDMRYATVYCEPLGGQNAKEIVAALNRHKGFLRGEQYAVAFALLKYAGLANPPILSASLCSPYVRADL